MYTENEKPALLIIDMIKENFDVSKRMPVSHYAKQMIPSINRLSAVFRKNKFPVVFSTDCFTEKDFYFTGKMKPHSISGTVGCEIVDELDFLAGDYWQQKPNMSAFFKTGLEDWLRRRKVTLCVVAGIATQFCVLATVLDALSHDFRVVFLEDCTATESPEMQTSVLNIYRRNPLYPLLRVASSEDVINELSHA